MVSGHLQVKKGYYYAVLSYYDSKNKRHVKYISTGLSEKGNKRKAEAELVKIRNAFEPPAEIGELCSNMLFADYLLGWLEIVKVRVKPTTFGSYESMVKQTIEPYFRNKPITLKDLEARHIQQFYSEKLRTVKPNSVIHYHAVTHQALKYAMKTDLVFQPNYAFARRAIRYQMNHYTWPCEWRQLMPEVFYQYVMQTGDLELVTEYYDRLVNECSFIDRFEGGLIRDWPMRVIVDWPFPCRDGYEFGPGEAVPNAHACNGWKRLAELGRLIGRHDDATRFEAAAAALTAAPTAEIRKNN